MMTITNTTETFDEIITKIHTKFISDIKHINEDEIYWENGWNNINIIFEETKEQMTLPLTVYLKELQSSYKFDFKIKTETIFDEQCMTISIHIPLTQGDQPQ